MKTISHNPAQHARRAIKAKGGVGKAAAAKTPRQAPKKSTEHGRSINAILEKMKSFDWDFDAMKRA